jgi:hypothetical protein
MVSSEGMDIVRTPARTVVIIGADPCGDIRAIAGAVAAQRGELVVLATGWPLTAAQQRVIHEATDVAADLRLPFEARLVYSEAEVEDHLLPDDTVVIAGGVETDVPRPVPSFA